MNSRFHNYNQPINYVCIEVPDTKTCQRLRTEGIPFPDCKKYSVAFKVNDDRSAGAVIRGWEGYAYECPVVPTWDAEGPWSILQTEILTTGE